MSRPRNKNTKQEDAWIKEGYDAARAGLGKDACKQGYPIIYRACWFVGWQRGGGNMKTGEVVKTPSPSETKGGTP